MVYFLHAYGIPGYDNELFSPSSYYCYAYRHTMSCDCAHLYRLYPFTTVRRWCVLRNTGGNKCMFYSYCYSYLFMSNMSVKEHSGYQKSRLINYKVSYIICASWKNICSRKLYELFFQKPRLTMSWSPPPALHKLLSWHLFLSKVTATHWTPVIFVNACLIT